MSTIWIGFFLAIIVLLVVARKALSLSLFLGSLVLGVTTVGGGDTLESLLGTVTNPSYLWFSFALGLFPILGALLKEIGAFDDLIQNLRLGKKTFLAFSAALIGLLPVPGGALISAPIIKKVAGSIQKEKAFLINIWFRHVLILVYPIGPALLIPVKIANLNVYDVIPYLFPFFLALIALGYIFLLRGIEEDMEYEGKAAPRKLIMPIFIILLPLLIDYGIKRVMTVEPADMVLFFAVLSSTLLAMLVGKVSLKKARSIAISSKFWKFILIMMTMFMFIDVFSISGVGGLISQLDVPAVVLCVLIGFLLAFVTGRTQLSASVVIPAYLATTSLESMPLMVFATTFVGIFLGYLISPLHPCISVSLEYFEVKLDNAIKTMAPETMIALAITAMVFMIST
ncbi:MAG: DUF401 family protein [Candidatus Methanofastidiosa archaeon]|nr:DUF401 family protein [Candidatus Methanofastidiosa archaeon]